MSKKKATAISLPLSRTAKIMTSAVGVESVNQDIVALATKATEIFLMDFARRAYDRSSNGEIQADALEYDDIQKLVHDDSRYEFLTDTIPKRIKFSEALRLVEEANIREEDTKRRRAEYAASLQERREKKAKSESNKDLTALNKNSEPEVKHSEQSQHDQNHVQVLQTTTKLEDNNTQNGDMIGNRDDDADDFDGKVDEYMRIESASEDEEEKEEGSIDEEDEDIQEG